MNTAPKKEPDQSSRPNKKPRVPSTGCPYYNQNNMELYKDRVAAQVHDMEQLLSLGKEVKACPYYSTRYAIPGAQVRDGRDRLKISMIIVSRCFIGHPVHRQG